MQPRLYAAAPQEEGRLAVPSEPTHLLHLALRHSTAVINDSRGLKARGLVELNEQLPHHVGQVLNDLLAEELLLQHDSSVSDTETTSGTPSVRACTLKPAYLRHVLPRRLNSNCGAVATGVTVHAAHYRCDGRLLPITSWRMSDVGTQEDDGLLEH